MIEVIPAIDLRGGRCVRLRQGRFADETVYSDDPVATARRWEQCGARRLHVVDLDGARSGAGRHRDVIRDITAAVDMAVQVGGGIRTTEDVEGVLDLGVCRVIIGSGALQRPDWAGEMCRRFGDQVVIGIDARDGKVAVHGWEETSEVSACEFAAALAAQGARRVIFTDIARDGMLSGPNLDSLRAMAESCGIPVIASGGVSAVADIEQIAGLESFGVEGAIVGRALYDGAVDLTAAIAAAAGAV